MSTGVLNTITEIDNVLESIQIREEICSKLDEYFSQNTLILDKAVEIVLSCPKKEMREIIERTSILRNRTIEKLFLLDKKFNIHCNLDAIDYNLFLNKLENIIKIAEHIRKDQEISFDIYKYLTPKQKILAFEYLKTNWDTYGAKPISRNAIKSSSEFVDALTKKGSKIYFVAPSPNEGVIIELKTSDRKVRFDYEKNNEINYFFFDKNKIVKKGKVAKGEEYSLVELLN